MATFVTDQFIEQQIREWRAESGVDQFDEVWDGIYYVLPTRDIEHQRIVGGLTTIAFREFDRMGLGEVYPGACVSDREVGWENNYRFPDVVVVMNGSRAKDCDTHFCGGPDFMAEIVTAHDHSREKLPFYGKIGVRELMIIDRAPWGLELYQLRGDELQLAGRSRVAEPTVLTSAPVLQFSFRLNSGESRPQIEVTHRDGVQRWIV